MISDILRGSLAKLTISIIPLSKEIIRILTKRCCDALLPVRSIPSQFRAMSNKRTPTEPSYFVSSILRPIKQFFGIGFAEGPGSHLTDHVQDYSTGVFNNVTVRCVFCVLLHKKGTSLQIFISRTQVYNLFVVHEEDRGVVEET
jgi:hypothetical protein